MTPLNSRNKGARGETEFIRTHLAPYWPEACRNLDQFGAYKNDVLRCNGVHWQLKRVERFSVWDAIRQAQSEAGRYDLPIVAFRRNNSREGPNGWYCIVEASELIALLRLREQ